MRLNDTYFIGSEFNTIFMPRIDKIVPIDDVETAQKLSVRYVYNMVRMVEATCASHDMNNPYEVRNIFDPYYRFLYYFTKNGEIGPPNLSFDTLKEALLQRKEIPSFNAWNRWDRGFTFDHDIKSTVKISVFM